MSRLAPLSWSAAGDNTFGQLGDGSNATVGTPQLVGGGLTFQTLSVGFDSSCGLLANGSGYCWGQNEDGQVGDGTLNNRSMPTAVTGNLSFQLLSAGGQHTCGLTTANAAYCWGNNDGGKLGNSGGPVSTPQRVAAR
jgi:alpha-tubulin suppressor-like RCC1 family protein